MSRKLVYRNDQEIRRLNDAFNNSKNLLQAVCDEFQKIGVGTIGDRDEFLQAVNDPEKYVLDETGRTIEAQNKSGFKIKKSKLFELADLPDPQQFYDACKVVRDAPELLRAFTHFGACNKNGKISIDKKKLDQFIDRNSVFAETPRELEVFEHLQRIADSCKELTKLGLAKEFPNNRARDVIVGVGMNWEPVPHLQTFRRLTSK